MKLCHVDELENNSAKGFRVNGKAIFAVKKAGEVYVYLNACPHLGINLEFKPDAFLDLDKRFIQCANHGALFEISSGECIVGPCGGQYLDKIAFTVKEGFIVVAR